jgi:anti-sigma-K factor RskA
MSNADQISSYLLGELDAGEAAAFERRLEADRELREEVARLRPLVSRLETLPAAVWEAPEPPPLAMPEGAAEPPALGAEADPAARPAPRSRWRFPALTPRAVAATGFAALMLAIGVAGGLLIAGDGGSGSPEAGTADLVLERIDDGPSGAHGAVVVAGDERRAKLQVSGLEPSGSGRFYELWLLEDDGSMIALGTFQVGADGRADVELPIPVPPSQYRYFDVSLQKDNGNPAHSGISVLRGATSS